MSAAAGGASNKPASRPETPKPADDKKDQYHIGLAYIGYKVVGVDEAKEWSKSGVVPMKLLQDANRGWDTYTDPGRSVAEVLRGSRDFKRSVLEVAAHVASGRLVPTQGLQFLKRVQANVNVKLGEAEGQPEGAALVKRFQEALVDTLSMLFQQANAAERKLLIGLVKDLVAEAVVDRGVAERCLTDDALSDFLDFSKSRYVKGQDLYFKKFRQANTGLLYKQTRFNVLNEETEGYAKVLTCLDQLRLDKRVSVAMAQLRALIGCFDLDPNRVADLILTAYEHNIDEEAYLELLEMGDFKKDYLAQLTGHKFAAYARPAAPSSSTDMVISDAAASKDPTSSRRPPGSLYTLTASLTARGMVSFMSVLPHLQPDIPDILVKQLAARESAWRHVKTEGFLGGIAKGGGLRGALDDDRPDGGGTLMQGGHGGGAYDDIRGGGIRSQMLWYPLGNVEDGVAAAEEAARDEPEVFLLLAHMLDLSYWDSATRVLKYLTAAGVHAIESPSVLSSLLRLVDRSIDPLFTKLLQPLRKAPSFLSSPSDRPAPQPDSGATDMDVDPPRAANGDPLDDSVSGRQQGKAFEPITDLASMPQALSPLLAFLGPYVADNAVVYSKLLRLFREYWKAEEKGLQALDSAVSASHPFVQCLGDCLLPGLSLAGCNPCLWTEVWDLVGRMPWRLRYSLYTRWKGAFKCDGPFMRFVASEHRALDLAKTVARTLDIDRVKEFFRPVGRLLGCTPLTVMDNLCKRMEGMDPDVINCFVEVLKQVSELGLDIVVFTIYQRLHKAKRNMFKYKSNEEEDWYKPLAAFAGMLFKKYPQVDCLPLIEFVNDTLLHVKLDGLLLLSELLSRMGGMPTLCEEGLSEQRIQGRGGGDVLKMETAAFGVREKSNSKAVKRLRDLLLRPVVGKPLLLLLANLRTRSLYGGWADKETELFGGSRHIKASADLYDRTNALFMQLSEFASGGERLEEKYQHIVPPLPHLVLNLKLEPQTALHLLRPLMRAAIKAEISGATTEAARAKVTEWHPFGPSMEEQVRKLLPTEVWERLPVKLYLAFWSLQLYDVDVPGDVYKEEIKRISMTIKDLKRAMDEGKREGREKKRENKERKKQLNQTEQTNSRLAEEMAEHKTHHHAICQMLKKHKGDLFPRVMDKEADIQASQHALLQHCVLPRALLSPADARYTARFFYLLLGLDMANFESLNFLALLATGVVPCVFSATEHEATNLGIFLRTLFEPLVDWFDNKAKFQAEANKESFKRYFSRIPNEKNRSEFDRYQRYFNHWQRRVTQVLCAALGNAANLAIGEDGKGEAYGPDDNTKIAAVRTIFEIAVESGEQRETRRCVPTHREYVQALVDSMGLLIPPKTEKLNAFQVRATNILSMLERHRLKKAQSHPHAKSIWSRHRVDTTKVKIEAAGVGAAAASPSQSKDGKDGKAAADGQRATGGLKRPRNQLEEGGAGKGANGEAAPSRRPAGGKDDKEKEKDKDKERDRGDRDKDKDKGKDGARENGAKENGKASSTMPAPSLPPKTAEDKDKDKDKDKDRARERGREREREKRGDDKGRDKSEGRKPSPAPSTTSRVKPGSPSTVAKRPSEERGGGKPGDGGGATSVPAVAAAEAKKLPSSSSSSSVKGLDDSGSKRAKEEGRRSGPPTPARDARSPARERGRGPEKEKEAAAPRALSRSRSRERRKREEERRGAGGGTGSLAGGRGREERADPSRKRKGDEGGVGGESPRMEHQEKRQRAEGPPRGGTGTLGEPVRREDAGRKRGELPPKDGGPRRRNR